MLCTLAYVACAAVPLSSFTKSPETKSVVNAVLDPSIWFENCATVIVPVACVSPLLAAPTSAQYSTAGLTFESVLSSIAFK